MEINNSHQKQAFKIDIDHLLDEMQKSYNEGYIQQRTKEFQTKLDRLAEKYQHDESLGKISYKLYEAQAYLHFFYGDYENALIFINRAVDIKGNEFSGSRSLKSTLNKKTSSMTTEPNKPLTKITGWLALFVVGIGISVLYNLYYFILDLISLNHITPTISATFPNLRSSIITEQVAIFLLAVFGIIILYFIYKHSHLVKPLSIIFLVSSLLWFGYDLSLAQQMFANNAVALKAVSNVSPTDENRSIVYIIWLIYAIFSKQIKRVLIE